MKDEKAAHPNSDDRERRISAAADATARHLGDPATEYRAIRDAVGVVNRDDLAQIRMFGRDPVRMLNGLITNDLTQSSPERAIYAALLTPKGRMISDLRVIKSASEPVELLIDVARAALPDLGEHLKKYVPPLFARWEETDTQVIGVYGPASQPLLSEVLGIAADAQEDTVRQVEFDNHRVASVATRVAGGEEGFDVFVPSSFAGELRENLIEAAKLAGGGAVGFGPFEVLRIEAGRPRYGIDMDAGTLPAEAYESTGSMRRAVSFTKGCYTGQEVVVRIAHRGHVNRHLRGLLLGDSEPASPRTPLHHPETGKEVGWTTSAAYSPMMQQTVALSFVRREVNPGDGIRVGLDGPLAKVVDLPFSK